MLMALSLEKTALETNGVARKKETTKTTTTTVLMDHP